MMFVLPFLICFTSSISDFQVFQSKEVPEKTSSPEESIRMTKGITMATAKAVAAGNSCRQEDVICTANLSRKAVSDMLTACKVQAWRCSGGGRSLSWLRGSGYSGEGAGAGVWTGAAQHLKRHDTCVLEARARQPVGNDSWGGAAGEAGCSPLADLTLSLFPSVLPA